MERNELVATILIVLFSMIAGFLSYSFFFYPVTAEVRPRFSSAWALVFQWLKKRRKRIVAVLAASAALLLLLAVGLRFKGLIAGFLRPAAPAPEPELVVESPPESPPEQPESIWIADHRVIDWVRLDRLPEAAIAAAKQKLHIFYSYGTHGSQISYGLRGLPAFKGALYEGLDLRKIPVEKDESYPAFDTWTENLRAFLSDPLNQQTNVVMWSWTSELSTATAERVENYLNLMSALEADYPRVRFVYMTGHLDGTGTDGNLHQRNEQIRAFCRAGRKALFDFADIESYDPDGNYYLDKRANDGCWYDSDGDGLQDKNWAHDWSEANPGKWYMCYSAHTYPLNANMKAYAAWWLWANLAGWEGG